MFNNYLTVSEHSTLGVLSGLKDPIPLRHFGLKETKAKVDLMEDQYDCPMEFDEAWSHLTQWLQGRASVPGVRVWLFMVRPKVTGDSIPHLH